MKTIEKKVVTWQAASCDATINICPECEARLRARGEWPKHQRTGEEYCQVSFGLHVGECDLCKQIYTAEIDGGKGGKITIEAANRAEAWAKAQAWADAGDYSNHRQAGLATYDLTLYLGTDPWDNDAGAATREFSLPK
jgi:hypothetical protein